MSANEEHLESEYLYFIKSIEKIIEYLEQGDNKYVKKNVVIDMLFKAMEGKEDE